MLWPISVFRMKAAYKSGHTVVQRVNAVDCKTGIRYYTRRERKFHLIGFYTYWYAMPSQLMTHYFPEIRGKTKIAKPIKTSMSNWS